MAEPRSRKPSSPTSSSATPTPEHGGNGWPTAAPGYRGRCGRPRRPRTRDYPDTLYVDSLIGPDTVNTLPESTLQAFEDHGTLARTIDVEIAAAEQVMRALARAGVDMDDVGHTLEREGIAAFQASFTHVLGTLDAKLARRHRRRRRCRRTLRWTEWTGQDGRCSGCWPPPS